MKKRRNKSLLVALLLLILTAVFGFSPERVEAAGKVQMKKAVIRLSKTVYTYNGKVQKPAVTVKYRGKKLKVNKDYTLTYSKGRKNPGVYTVAVKGKSRYTGTVRKTFRINPVGTKLVSMQSPAGGTTLKLTWKRPSRAVSGYQLRYSTRKDFKGAKIQTISGATKTTATLKSLKPGTRYYLQIRSFYRYTKTKSTYSAWSKLTAKTTAKKADSSGNNGTPDNGNTSKTDNDQKNDTKETEPPKSDNDQKETRAPETEPPALTFSDGESAVIKTTVGESFGFSVSNRIQSITVSDPDTVLQYTDSPYTFCAFTAVNPGKTKIIFTDIYGQKLISYVMVTQKMSGAGVTAELTSIRYDMSLLVPKISSIYYNANYVGINCPGTFSSSDSYVGYEAWISTFPDFTTFLKQDYTTSQWNRLGYGRVSFFYTREGTTYYVKVRSFKWDGNVKVCGPWSSARSVNVGNYSVKSENKTQFSYKLYFLDSTGSELYSGTMRAVYIQTENPDPSSIELIANGKSVFKNITNWNCAQYYDDIDYTNKDDYDKLLHKVQGGYVGYLNFDDAGTYNVEVREVQKEGYIVAKTVRWTVKDYKTALYAWVDQIIAEHTNSSMTAFEKMDAVCSYLNTPDLFHYVTQSNGKNVTLAALPNGPCFRTYRWDSYTSPYMLCVFAERIGGFDKIHNCYGDYPIGSAEWSSTHYYAKLTIGAEERLYVVCPLSLTGEIGEVKKIDFSNTAALRSAE